jgi:hypothetical protein
LAFLEVGKVLIAILRVWSFHQQLLDLVDVLALLISELFEFMGLQFFISSSLRLGVVDINNGLRLGAQGFIEVLVLRSDLEASDSSRVANDLRLENLFSFLFRIDFGK